ncbi:BnaA09g14860D [Brassica napus]|uniref:BnaA09g14860D protein n=1 Tax=Brassica napus TaxID=3708 RepID=A0A078HRJ0_BRANA|nr:BnaA09g14860D [Brassica napus]
MGALLETHIKEPNLSSILKVLCPGWNHVSNHDTDFDGRIVIIWKFPAVVDVLHQSRQSMTCNVSLPGDNNFTFTAVYAANTREERTTLWEELFEIQTTLFLENKKWLIGGDLNQITHYQEHSSPTVDHLSTDMLELKDNLNQLGVSDLRFQGCANTWTNKNPSAPVTKKLDRALINSVWLESFPNSVASFLAHEFSDHSPCLIDLACPLPHAGTKPFKFQNFLPQHPSFLQVVETAWFQSGSVATDLSTLGFKIKGLKRVMKTLARDKFSDIQKRVISTNSLLKDVQVQCLNQPNEENFQVEKDMITHWTFLRGVEEAFFKQKSRINWLRLGDQNTLFFMRVAATRNSYNSIRSLQLPCGLLVTDSIELCEIALAHFQSILSPVHLPPLSSPFHWFLELLPFRCSPVQQTILSSLPDTTEIAKTILKLNPNKSPGPDGFTSAFFKSS